MDREESPNVFQNTQMRQSDKRSRKKCIELHLKSTTMNDDVCSFSSFLAPLESYRKSHSNKGITLHFMTRNNVESSPPLIVPKDKGMPVATPPEIQRFFFLS